MATLHNRQVAESGPVGLWRYICTHRRQMAEGCWCSVALILFLLLGPFAAPIVVMAIFNLPAEERGTSEPETYQEAVRFQLR